MPKRKKVVEKTAIIFFGFLLVLFVFFASYQSFKKSSDDDVQASINEALNFFYRRPPSRGDVLWVVSHAMHNLQGLQGFDLRRLKLSGKAVNREIEFASFFLENYEPFLMPEKLDFKPRKPRIKLPMDMVLLSGDFMKLSINCRTQDSAGLLRLKNLLATKGSGYHVTHQLWAAVTARELGCFPKESWAKRIHILSQQVYSEFLHPREIDDLTVEQAAILCYAGYCDSIDKSFVDDLVRLQKPQGDWGAKAEQINDQLPLFDEYTREHMAALALYFLSYWYALNAS